MQSFRFFTYLIYIVHNIAHPNMKYYPQNEMFVNRKTKRYIFKTKRIFFVSPSITQIM